MKILLILISIVAATNFTWLGNTIYWNNINNWSPTGIPSYFDNVYIPYNASTPLYIDSPIEISGFTNNFYVNIFNTTARMNWLENNGCFSVYISNFTLAAADNNNLLHFEDATLHGNYNNRANGTISGGGWIENVINNGVFSPRVICVKNFVNIAFISYDRQLGAIYGDYLNFQGQIDVWAPQYLMARAPNFTYNAISNVKLKFVNNSLFFSN
jgi:hypothetical protein